MVKTNLLSWIFLCQKWHVTIIFFFYGKKKMICCHKFYFVEKVFVFGIILNFMVKNNIATNSP